MIHLVGYGDLVSLFDFDEVTEVHKFDLFYLLLVTAHLNDDVLCPQVTIHSSSVRYVLQQDANLEDEVGELRLAIFALVKNSIKVNMLQLIGLDHFSWIKVDFPKQFMKTISIFKVLLALVDDPDVGILLIIDHLLDVENQIPHSLTPSHFLIQRTFQVLNALDLLFKCRQVAWNLLNQEIVHDFFLFNNFFLLE